MEPSAAIAPMVEDDGADDSQDEGNAPLIVDASPGAASAAAASASEEQQARSSSSSSSPAPTAPAPTMFQVFDRRINFATLPPDASLYAMLRAWVQDDPARQLQPWRAALRRRPVRIGMDDDPDAEEAPLPVEDTGPLPAAVTRIALPRPAPETAMTLLRLTPSIVGAGGGASGGGRASPTARSPTPTTAAPVVPNSLLHVPPETLLDLHVGYMREVRRSWQKARARRYQRFQTRLRMLGVPPCTALEKALASSSSTARGRAAARAHAAAALGAVTAAAAGAGGSEEGGGSLGGLDMGAASAAGRANGKLTPSPRNFLSMELS